MSSRLLYTIIFGFAGGVLIRSLVIVPEAAYVFLMGTATVSLFLALCVRHVWDTPHSAR